MLPANSSAFGQISDVAGNVLAALRGEVTPWGFAPVSKLALIVVDGLGFHNLMSKSGHARRLATWASEGDRFLHSGLPSTTSSALASLTTGQPAGVHGLAGYTVLDPESGQLLNHLKPFPVPVIPEVWQPCPTVFETLAGEGIASVAVGEARFDGTDFSRAVLRGADYVASNRLADHTAIMREFFDSNERGLCYLYWPALDRIGHSQGVDSAAWVDELEALDAWVAQINETLRDDEAAVLTADHGMITVTDQDHVVMAANDLLRGDIAAWGGEPRCVHLYRVDGVEQDGFVERVRNWVGQRGDVVPREQLIESGAVGAVSADNAARFGDVVIFANDAWVFYDEATASPSSYRMVGQHGSHSVVETTVPLVSLGAWRG